MLWSLVVCIDYSVRLTNYTFSNLYLANLLYTKHCFKSLVTMGYGYFDGFFMFNIHSGTSQPELLIRSAMLQTATPHTHYT